jgi:hypothetical protein
MILTQHQVINVVVPSGHCLHTTWTITKNSHGVFVTSFLNHQVYWRVPLSIWPRLQLWWWTRKLRQR